MKYECEIQTITTDSKAKHTPIIRGNSRTKGHGRTH
jgi:hypothetical protein